MRTSRRATTVTMAPPEWRSRCRKNASEPKIKKTWWRKYVDLIDEGYTPCIGSWTEHEQAARRTCCGCSRELKALELIGDEGELVMYQTFAVCPQCRDWIDI